MKYNKNADKSSEDLFGFTSGCECWEFRNNTSNQVLFKTGDMTGWENNLESRYPEENTDITELQKVFAWVASTDRDAVSSASEKQARLNKFKTEFNNYFEKQSATFYYLFTEFFLMVDSRAKNMFLTKYNGSKWMFLPYDFDTALGINNEGTLTFGPFLEDIDQDEKGADVFNGQKSVLWVNFRDAFRDDIEAMYKTLRSNGSLNYNDVVNRFKTHQDKWPVAIVNDDAYFKYLEPLIHDGNANYLDMVQGLKTLQREWWLLYRFAYMDSKYNAGDSSAQRITVRAYAKSSATLTPYSDLYATIRYGSHDVQKRVKRNQSALMECTLDNLNDTEVYIFSAPYIKDVGDLSGLKVGFADFAAATKLQKIKLGDKSSSYSNTNLERLQFGNNALLTEVDVRNCSNLKINVNLANCTNLRKAYFGGSGITGLSLAPGSVLEEVEYPATVTNITLLDQNKLKKLTVEGWNNVSTLRIEKCPGIDALSIFNNVKANTRVRIIGFTVNEPTGAAVKTLLDKLDTMRGLDENGNNVARPQLSGTIHVASLTGKELLDFQTRYPEITYTFDNITSTLYYHNWDGSEVLHTQNMTNGGNGTWTGTTTRPQDEQYSYTFVGWSKKMNSTTADPDAVANVIADRHVYPAFSRVTRTYTVTFMVEGKVAATVENVPYNGTATYPNGTPVSSKGPEHTFRGWWPEPNNIKGPTACEAYFWIPTNDKQIEESWETILGWIEAGTHTQHMEVGNYKELNLGAEGTIRMRLVAMDADRLAAGGKAKTSWVSADLLATSKQYNAVQMTETDDGSNYVVGTGTIGGWESSDIRKHLRNVVFPLIPAEVRNAIKPVTKLQLAVRNGEGERELEFYNQTTTDTVWIPSYIEMYNAANALYIDWYRSDSGGGRANAYRIQARPGQLNENGNGEIYWLRDSYPGQLRHMSAIYANGGDGYFSPYLQEGTPLGFCI